MKIYIITLLLLFITSTSSYLHADDDEDKMEFGGYLENTTSIVLADTAYFTDNALIRLEGSYALEDKAELEMHILLSSGLNPLSPFAGMKKNSLMYDLMSENIESITEGMDSSFTGMIEDFDLNSLNYLAYSSLYPKDQIMLDRAVLKLYFKHFDLFAGRQQMAWGTGYAFNPTDIWNMKNPLDPSAPKVGVNAIRAEIPFGDLSNLSLVFSPGNDVKHSAYGFRMKSNAAGYDFSLSGIKYMNADRELYGLPEKVLLGADFAGQIFFEIGIWGEGTLVNPKYEELDYTDTDSAYVQIDLGMDYTFENGIYCMAEYYYNGLGESRKSNYNTQGLMYQLSGEMSGLGRDYLMAGLTYDFMDDYIFAVYALNNLNDISSVIMPELEYNYHQNLSLKLMISIFTGDSKTSEFGSMENSVGLKITGYF